MAAKSTRIQRLVKWLGFSHIGPTSHEWFGPISEANTGDWQKGITVDNKDGLMKNSAVYACVTGISADVAKMRIKLTRNQGGIWNEITTNHPLQVVLRKPNHYQNRIQFIQQWILSKLLHGNAYILKERDGRNVVNALYVLDPRSVIPLVTPAGDVWYQINQDPLSHVEDASITVPASEIIHDRMAPIYHPLIGVPPLYACALSTTLSNRILRHSAIFFQNRAIPGGMLTAPGTISEETAKRLKEDYETKYAGHNVGRLLVLGDGLEFKLMQMTAEHAQLADQLKLSKEDIAVAFHYPLFKLGGALPAYAGNVEALIVSYYTDCLQELMESFELCLDEGLELAADLGTELDLESLMRMDTAALYDANNKAVGGGWMAPNEARYKANYNPTEGGDTPYLQQQNYSLRALAERDAQEDLWAKPTPPKPEPGTPPAPPPIPPSPSKAELQIVKDFARGRYQRRRTA